MPRLKTVVMVPKGAEFNAVQKGLQSVFAGLMSSPVESNQATKFLEMVSLPVGPEPVRTFLRQWCINQAVEDRAQEIHVIVMGLCGSLTPSLQVGDVVAYAKCIDGELNHSDEALACSIDVPLVSASETDVSVTAVTGVMCDRVLSTVAEKQAVSQRYGAQVVDMEGAAVLRSLQDRVGKISILRVVSDDAQHNLPNLNDAFDVDGNIRSGVMARQFLQQPMGAIRLIRGSLSGLNVLEKLSRHLALGIQKIGS